MNRALRAATMGVLLLSPVVLSACSAGQVTQTATQERDKTGAQAQVGDITLREVTARLPRTAAATTRGDDAELQLAIVNGGTEDDTLVGVRRRRLLRRDLHRLELGGSRSSGAADARPAPRGTTSASRRRRRDGRHRRRPRPPPRRATACALDLERTRPPAPTELAIPAGQRCSSARDDRTITLTGLQPALTTGQYLEVTLTFEKAGEVTIPVDRRQPAVGR